MHERIEFCLRDGNTGLLDGCEHCHGFAEMHGICGRFIWGCLLCFRGDAEKGGVEWPGTTAGQMKGCPEKKLIRSELTSTYQRGLDDFVPCVCCTTCHLD